MDPCPILTQTSCSPPAHDQADGAVLMFGPFALHRSRQLLLKGEQPVRIGSRAFGLLVDLVESAGQLRTRQQLEASVWPRSVVEETSLRVHMSALRRALGDGREGARYIANIPGCGYSFIATVTRVDAAAAASRPLPLPASQPARLIGRDAELAALREQCLRARLLSIVGPGGIGKTSLARAAAQLLSAQFADGVVFVDLTAVDDAASLIDTVADVVGVALAADRRMPSLCAGLAHRRLLIVLDSCERAIDAVAVFAAGLLQHDSAAHLLATSREPLDVEGEQVHWLDVLRIPDYALADPAEAMACAAVELFVTRATARDDRFVLDAVNVHDVCRLCRFLDGIPLAIELAAARVEAMGVAGLSARIGDLLALLTRARRSALPRHRTMETTLAWSYDLLTDEERLVLCRSGIFQASFSLEAAVAVCVCARINADLAARCIESLAAKSLLVRGLDGGSALFRLLALTRTYAFAKLDGAERRRLAGQHAQHVAALLARSPAAVMARAPLPWLGAHGYAFEDVIAALEWAFGHEGDSMLGAAITPNLIYTLRYLGMPDNFRRRLVQALDQRDVPGLGPQATVTLYAGLAILGAYSHTDGSLQKSILAKLQTLFEHTDIPALRLQALVAIAVGAYGIGEYGVMRELMLSLRQRDGLRHDRACADIADRLEASGCHYWGEHVAAEALMWKMLRALPPDAPVEVVQPTPMALEARWILARIAWIRGKPEQAALLSHEAMADAGQYHLIHQCQTLTIMALPVALWRGDLAYAAQLLARLQALAAACRSTYWETWALAYSRALALPGQAAAPPWCAALAPIAQDMMATLGCGMLDAATFARAETGASGWCAPEVLRARGEQLLEEGEQARTHAYALFLRAHALARQQQALGWELRIVCSMLRCWPEGERASENRGLLAAVLARFDEGRDTLDCRAAAALLEHGA